VLFQEGQAFSRFAACGKILFGVAVSLDEGMTGRLADWEKIQARNGGLFMSAFRVNLVAVNHSDTVKRTPPIDALVDTGSELTWLPGDVLQAAGITPLRHKTFQTATRQTFERSVGYAIIKAEGFETIDEVVFAEPTDMVLLGVRTIEGFGVMVDNIAHRFVATATLAV
jgi:predicted aspartyl protease